AMPAEAARRPPELQGPLGVELRLARRARPPHLGPGTRLLWRLGRDLLRWIETLQRIPRASNIGRRDLARRLFLALDLRHDGRDVLSGDLAFGGRLDSFLPRPGLLFGVIELG